MKTIDDLLCLWEENRDAGTPISPEELCANAPELLKELKWTIRALEAVESRFGVISTEQGFDPAAEASSLNVDLAESVLVSSEYRIEKLHASGGLGSVYIATDPVLNRRVAIKFPRWKNLTVEQAARFEREARVTGRLDHPGIIPVHALKSGRSNHPCYVMRFVDGTTLQARIETLHSSASEVKSVAFFESHEFRQLLQNLIAVCNIVAYAHGQGVIHRDIKPANIILGPFGEVLLLDWGLAKVQGDASQALAAISTDGSASLFETRDGQIMGTPAFASPEQLMGQTDDVAQRSDVYSLGATLFLLITGAFSIGNSALHEHLNRLKQKRQFSVHELNPLVPVALEAICRHAMQIRPEDRYESAVSLAQDLERFLLGESVSVCRDAPAVRLGRWIRRRPGLAAASATGILIASLAGAAGAFMLGQKNQELQSNNQKLEAAVEDSRSANVQTLKALRTLFDDVVAQKLGAQAKLTDSDREFLQKILQQYETFASLKGDSIESRAIRAEGLQQSGTILVQLAEEQEARSRFEAAAEIYQQLVDETDQAEYRRQLAATLVDLGLMLQNYGEMKAAEQAARRGIDLLKPVLVDGSKEAAPAAWEAYANLHQLVGGIQIASGQMKEALASFSESKDVYEYRRSSAPESLSTLGQLAEAYRAMSDACQQLGDIAGQEKYSQQALDLYSTLIAKFPDDRKFGEGFTWACYDRSYAHEFFERHPSALKEMNEAVDLAAVLSQRFPLSDEFRGVLAGMQIRRGATHARMGHFKLAEADLQQAIATFEKMIIGAADGAQSFRQLLKAERQLAILQHSFGQLEKAEATFRKSRVHAESFIVAYPETAARSWEVCSHSYDLAMVLSDAGRFDEAEMELQNRLDAADQNRTGSIERIEMQSRLEAKCGLVKVRVWNDDRSAAMNLTNAVSDHLQELQDVLPEDSKDWDIISQYHLQVGNFYEGLGNSVEGKSHVDQHLLILKRIASKSAYPPAGLVTLMNALVERADIFAEKEDYALASQQCADAVSLFADASKLYPRELSLQRAHEEVLWTQGRLEMAQKKLAEAMPYFEKAIQLNAASRHRAIRLYCMGLLKDARTLTELKAAADEPAHSPSLSDQIRACGAIATDNPASDQVELAVSIAQQLLEKAHQDAIFLRPSVLKRLRASAEFTELCKHQDLSPRLDLLDPTIAAGQFE